MRKLNNLESKENGKKDNYLEDQGKAVYSDHAASLVGVCSCFS